MTTRFKFCALLAVTVFTGACLPEKRIVWSPDGRQAALAAPRGLYFFDTDGKLLAPRLTNTRAYAAWFADSRRLAVAHTTQAAGWNEIASIFTEKQIDEITTAARAARERTLAYEGDWERFNLDPNSKRSPGMDAAVLFYMRDVLNEGLAAKLGEKWADFQKAEATIWQLQLFEYTPAKLVAGKVLRRSLDEMLMPAVSPSGKAVTFISKLDGANEVAAGLHVISTAGGEAQLVSESVALGYDWSRDGRSLAYIRGPTTAGGEQAVTLGSLATIEVADADGELLSTFARQEDHVGVLFSQFFGVRYMQDGRLLFSSVELALPATNRDMPQRWGLYSFDPRTPASVLRVLPKDFTEPLEMTNALFELSPDDRRVLIPGPKGRLYLYDFAAGNTEILVADELKDQAGSLPAWRNNDEFTFVRPAAGEAAQGPSEVVHWQGGTSRAISAAWPEAVRAEWLDKQ